MSKKIFVNIPVSDLKKSREFYEKLGFTIKEEFSDDQSAGVVVSDNILFMLLLPDMFKQVCHREVADTATTCEAVFAISVDSREEVDKILDGAISAGGKEDGETTEEEGIYSRGFHDPDGHKINVLHTTF